MTVFTRFVYLLSAFSLTAQLNAQNLPQITFSEVMFRTTSSENSEFIELYNNSQDTVNLSGFKFKYHTSSADILTPFSGGDSLLLPEQFAVILEGDYDLQSGVYAGEIDRNALVLKISDAAFGSSGMSNSSDRLLVLMNSTGDTVDTYSYSANNSTNHSDEKIILNGGNGASNWSNSLRKYGTPGYKNSVSPKDFDLAITGFKIQPDFPLEGDVLSIKMIVKNTGILPAENFLVQIYNDAQRDTTLDGDEILLETNVSSLSPGDSAVYTSQLDSVELHEYLIVCTVDFTADQKQSDNLDLLKFKGKTRPAVSGDIVVNEFMYIPPDGEPEWIELFNTSRKTLDLSAWQIRDKSSGTLIPGDEILIRPKEYLVLTKNDLISRVYGITSQILEISVPSLNNTGDQIRIVDEKNVTIDSLEFTRNWGGRYGGRSLERIDVSVASTDSTNWRTCAAAARATPGEINSVTQKTFDAALVDFFTEPREVTAGDTLSFRAKVKNSGIREISFILQLFEDDDLDSVGNSLKEISPTFLLSAGDSLIYNFGFKLSGIFKPRGFSVELISAGDQNSLNNLAYLRIDPEYSDADLVFNEIMNVPPDGQPEWIEMFNNSGRNVNILGWKISDRTSSVVIAEDAVIKPMDYLVITQDVTLTNFYSIPSQILKLDLPSLNNSDDDFSIYDAAGNMIDSLTYHSSWGSGSGISLERIKADGQTNASANWGGSVSAEGATPGKLNSLSQKDYDLALLDFIASPTNPLPEEIVKFKIRAANIGKFENSFVPELWLDNDNDTNPDSLLETGNAITISPGDSVVFNFATVISKLVSEKSFIGEISAVKDDDQSNNSLRKILRPIFPVKSVVINEILFDSEDREPEWFELFNKSEHEIDLLDWKIRDVFTTPAESAIDTSLKILPGEYLVVAKDSAVLNYHGIIPARIVYNQFPNLNNDRDGLVIRDFTGRVIDSVLYNENFNIGSNRSLERISAGASSTSPLNWRSSGDKEGSTPGRINSATPKKFDLTASELKTNPEFPVPGESVNFVLNVLNNGSENAADFSVDFFTGPAHNQFFRVDGLSLTAGQRISVTTSTGIVIDTKLDFSAVIRFPADEDTLNNSAESQIFAGYAAGRLLINEVMIDPPEGESEWLEIYNPSSESVNVSGWTIGDVLPSEESGLITDMEINLLHGEFLLIARDSSLAKNREINGAKFCIANFGTMGNYGDGVMLRDFRGALIDSFSYTGDWKISKGRSLERVSTEGGSSDSLNWTASIDASGATPGSANSVSGISPAKFNSVVINEIMYEPNPGNAEFVELYNPGQSAIDIGGWCLIESAGSPLELSPKTFLLNPGGYFTVANDSSLLQQFPELSGSANLIVIQNGFSLSNSGELLTLKDVLGNAVDSVEYDPDWHNPNVLNTAGKSLERLSSMISSVDASNWSTSANAGGASPGQANSILLRNTSANSTFEVSPNPFSPDGDGFEDFTSINYNLSFPIARIRIKVFDSVGRHVRTLENDLLSGAKGAVIFDGFNDSRRPLKMGIYILLIEVIDSSSGIMHTFKKAVVVARRL